MEIHGNAWESMEIMVFGENPWIFIKINIFAKITKIAPLLCCSLTEGLMVICWLLVFLLGPPGQYTGS